MILKNSTKCIEKKSNAKKLSAGNMKDVISMNTYTQFTAEFEKKK